MFKKRTLGITLCFISINSHAAMIDFYLSGGAAFSTTNNETSVQINDNQTNDYVTRTSSVRGPFGGIGIGHTYENINNSPVSVMLALTSGYYVGYQQINGIEYPMINDGVFDTLNYQFKAESFAAMAETRIFVNQYGVRPFLLLGVGASWNHLFDYSERPTNPDLSAAPVPVVYQNNVTTSFAYEGGLGIQVLLLNDSATHTTWYGAVEYRYMNTGKGELTAYPAITTNDTLKVTNLNMQAALVTLQISI